MNFFAKSIEVPTFPRRNAATLHGFCAWGRAGRQGDNGCESKVFLKNDYQWLEEPPSPQNPWSASMSVSLPVTQDRGLQRDGWLGPCTGLQ